MRRFGLVYTDSYGYAAEKPSLPDPMNART